MSNIEMSLSDVITLLKQAILERKIETAVAILNQTFEKLQEQSFCGYCGVISRSKEGVRCENCDNMHDADITGLFSEEDMAKLRNM